MNSTTAPSFETAEVGTIMRHGTTSMGGISVYPGRTQREVQPSRRAETISYKIEQDTYGMRDEVPAKLGREAERWNHYLYRFTYRYLGRSIQVTWRCGTGYGDPKPWDGLFSIFTDVSYFVSERDGGEDMTNAEFDAGEKLTERVRAFFAGDDEFGLWEAIVTGTDSEPESFTVTTYGAN